MPCAPRERRYPVLDRDEKNRLLDSCNGRDMHGLAVRECLDSALGHQRPRSAGAETTPTRTTASSSSAISVAHTGIPRE